MDYWNNRATVRREQWHHGASEMPSLGAWIAAHGWWTALIAGALLCSVAVVLS
ncbi:MAG TPA: hypothetical protein VLX09_20575 [Stellaceae bacterium]|nr:hypothetical protein [Stellaceae bacterium]